MRRWADLRFFLWLCLASVRLRHMGQEIKFLRLMCDFATKGKTNTIVQGKEIGKVKTPWKFPTTKHTQNPPSSPLTLTPTPAPPGSPQQQQQQQQPHQIPLFTPSFSANAIPANRLFSPEIPSTLSHEPKTPRLTRLAQPIHAINGLILSIAGAHHESAGMTWFAATRLRPWLQTDREGEQGSCFRGGSEGVLWGGGGLW